MKAVSGIVAMVLIALALAVAVAALVALIDFMRDIALQSLNLVEYRAQSAALAQSITGWWLQNENTLTINLTNNAAYTLLLTSITIVYNDTSLTVLDKGDQVNVTKPNGQTSIQTLPLPLPPATTLNITIDVNGKTVKQVSISLSASPIVVAIPLKNYYQVYPPAANVTLVQQPQPTVAELQRLSSTYTVTWGGTAFAGAIEERNGTVLDAENTTGLYLSGSPSSLITVDNNTYIIRTESAIELTYSAVFFDDFSTDPYADGRMINYGNWAWDPNLQAIYVHHYVTASQSGASSTPASDTNISVTYYNTSLLTLTSFINRYQATHVYIMYHTWFVGTVSLSSTSLRGVDTSAEAEYWFSALYDFNGSDGYVDGLYRIVNSTGGVTLFDYNLTFLYSTYSGSLNYTLISLEEPNVTYYKVVLWRIVEGSHNSTLYNETAPDTPYATVSLSEVKEPEANGTIGFYVLSGVRARGNTYYWWIIPIPLSASATINITYYFDNLVVSVADPRYVNVSGVPTGGIVELWDGSTIVARVQDGVNDTDGAADGLVELPVITHPISRDPLLRVYDSQGNLVLEQNLTHPVVGGQAYMLSYWVSFKASSQLNTTNLLRILDLKLIIAFNVSLTDITAYNVMVYDWNMNSFVDVTNRCTPYSSAGLTYLECKLDTTQLNPTNATVVYEVRLALSSITDVAFDQANTILKGVFSKGSTKTLIVASGGTTLIDFYQISGNKITYLYTINASTIFNGTASISYTPLGNTLLLINESGIYATTPPSGNWLLVTANCRATGLGALIEAVNTTSSIYVVAVPGSNNRSLCIVQVDPDTLNVTGLRLIELPTGIEVTTYAAASSNATQVYLIALNTTSGKAVLIEVDAIRTSLNILNSNVPGSKPLGLDYGDGKLWLMLEGGSVYYYDFANTIWNYYNIQLPFYPWKPGDRLEYNDGVLIFVRDDDTNEVWFIPVS